MRQRRRVRNPIPAHPQIPSGAETVKERHRAAKQKAHLHNLTLHIIMLVLYVAKVRHWHLGSRPFLQTVCRHHIFNLFRQKSHYLHHPASKTSTMKQPDPPCQKSENAITAAQSCVWPVQENNQRSTHPSREKGRVPFPISPLIWEGNEVVRKERRRDTLKEWEEGGKEEEYGV